MKINKLKNAGTHRFIARLGAKVRQQNGPRWLFFLLLIVFAWGDSPTLLAEDSALRYVSGVVLDEDTGQPIANVLVRASSPEIDMRFLQGRPSGLYDARTDSDGRFTIELPYTLRMSKNEDNPNISLNAFAPGYEEAARRMLPNGNWAFHDVPISADHTNQFTIELRPAFYVAGVVVDESGQPFSGASVGATLDEEKSKADVAFDFTDDSGRFEIFDFPLQPSAALHGSGPRRGQLTFLNSSKLTYVITDVYALSEAERTNLHVTLSSGHEVKGLITSALRRDNQRQPPAPIVVEVTPADKSAAHRTTLTDEDGRFEVRGLPDGEVRVFAHTSGFEQEARQTVQLAGEDAEVNFRLKPVVFENPPQPVSILGMTLAGMTPELQAVYDLDLPNGVLILDPGTNHLHLGFGALSQGDRFGIVGRKEIRDLPDMVAELLRINAIAPPGDPNEGCHDYIRVAYTHRNGAGTMNLIQILRLTDEDIAELKRVFH